MKLPLLATALLASGLALAADAAHASYSVAVKQRTLVVTGNGASEKLALRGRARRVQVDVRDDGRAEFSVARRRFDRIRVRAGGGDDQVRIDESKVVFTGKERTTLEGGPGNDTLRGGRGAERLLGGGGDDLADGNRGDDAAGLGAGDDRFDWDPGDGDDAVEGSDGRDSLTLDGSTAGEAFRVSPDGARARVVRDVGGVVLSLGALEQVGVNARGGADSLTTDELSATTLQGVAGNLGGADGATDRVVVNATNGDDVVDVSGADGAAAVAGVAVPVTIGGAETGRDQLLVNALAGFDRISSALAATTLSLTADGGAEDDTLAGGPAAETFLGGDGTDAVDGNQGDDSAFLGAGDDRFTWDPGDGSDRVEGQEGQDAMTFNGSGANESIVAAASGPRVHLTRDVGSIRMDLDDVERIDTMALAGSDTLIAGDLSGTDVMTFNADLAADGATDVVTVLGSAGPDALTASGVAGNATIIGGGRTVGLRGAQTGDTLVIGALGGNDTVDASALAAALRLTVDGGAGDDLLRGGVDADVLLGGDGADVVDGNQGADTAFLGAGDDRFAWDPGDGDDTLEGQAGQDTMAFTGSGVAEAFDVSANGTRVRFVRSVGNIVMDLDDIERIDTAALGGTDTLTSNDLSGTDVRALDVALGSDGAADDVLALASSGDDALTASGSGGSATLNGLPGGVVLSVTGAQVPADRLSVRLLAGDDRIDASGLAAGAIAFRAEGGGGADVLIGGAGADVLRGDAGDDVLVGGPANDDLDGGAGDNTVIQD